MAMSPEESNYRNMLIATQQKLNESYDRLVVTLSGGALALSLTFINNLVSWDEASYKQLLVTSWGLFIASLSFTLISISLGMRAYKTALEQFDANTTTSQENQEEQSEAHSVPGKVGEGDSPPDGPKVEDSPGERVGGRYSVGTKFFSSLSGIFLIVGLACISVFVYKNSGVTNYGNTVTRQETPAPTATQERPKEHSIQGLSESKIPDSE